ncbi:MAG: hypothetical protein ACXVYY_18160 [Oryzihumus sp.]
MFGRKKRSSVEARTRLLNTDFPCSSPGVELVRVDYDPAVWTRCPTRGEDRTTWAEQTLAAYVEDLGLSAEDPLRLRLAEALGRIADDPLSHTCTFVHLPTTGSGKDGQILVWVDVADEEVTLLEHGTPETFLAFTDLDPGHPEQPQVFQNGWSASAKMGLDEDGQSQWIFRNHRVFEQGTAGSVHVTAGGFGGRSADRLPMGELLRALRLVP